MNTGEKTAAGQGQQTVALSVEEALCRIERQVSAVTESERLPLKNALGRVLAEDITAPLRLPPWTNSAMDGYAVRGSDLSQKAAKELTVIGRSMAGYPFQGKVGGGQCVRIMTGAVLPAGCDTVLKQEDVERVGERICVHPGRHQPGEHVRRAGEDIEEKEPVFGRGHRLQPADLGLLASLGLASVEVVRRPVAAFFSTGDELQGLGRPLEEGAIYDSNRYTLHAMLQRLGVKILDCGHVPDDPEELEKTMRDLAGRADLVLSTGGVSVGSADYVTTTLAKLGEITFWKIAMKPGKPLLFGRLGGTLFFGLPGNPVSVMATFILFVRGAVLRLSGEVPPPLLKLRAHAAEPMLKRTGRTDYQRGILQQGEDGRLEVRPTGMQGSHMLSSMSRANCFIVLPATLRQVEQNQEVEVIPFNTIYWGVA